MLVLELNDGTHPGRTTSRDDFPPTARMLANLERPKERENPYIRKANENDHDHLMKRCDQNSSGKVGIFRKSTGRRHHLHLQQIGGSQENGMNHNQENSKISNGGKSGQYSLSEPSTFIARALHIHNLFTRTIMYKH